MKKHRYSILVLSVACVACAGGDIRSSLQKPAPDEFTVIPNQPLVVPPNFDLKAPGSSAGQTYEEPVSTQKLAREDKEFLNKIGTKNPTGAVKKKIDDEHMQKQSEIRNKGMITKTIARLNSAGQDKFVDPKAEKERLDHNITEGKALNEGDVPTREGKSTLEKIFN